MKAPPPLQGEALHEHLQHAWHLWQAERDDSGITRAERAAAVAEYLHQRPLAPADLSELNHLYTLWMALDAPDAANAALHQHRATVLSATNADRADPLHWELMELESRRHRGPGDSVERLAAIAAQMQADPALYRALDSQWGETAWRYQAWDLIEAHFEWRRRQPPTGDEPDAWRDAMLHQQKAHLAHQRDDARAMDESIHRAIAWFSEAARGKGLEFAWWWQQLAQGDVPLTPAQMDALVEAAQAHLHAIDPPLAAPILATRKAHHARWQARAAAHHQQWELALEYAKRGHFALEDDHDANEEASDHFGARMLDWYAFAGRMPEAAELAWHGIWNVRAGIAPVAYTLALQQAEHDPTCPHWNWILAFAQLRPGLLEPDGGDYPHPAWLEGHPPPPLPALAYLERAKTIARWHDALALLERGVLALPAYANARTLRQLWCARFLCLPAWRWSTRPFPESHGARWCYSIGCSLAQRTGRISKVCGEAHWDRHHKQRQALARHYFETARTRFEAFYARGEGAFMDTDFDIYSQLCNELGLVYYNEERYDDAITLYEAGLACKPIGQHYANLLYSVHYKGDHAGVIAAADRLWYGIQQHPHLDDHFNLARYALWIANALHIKFRHIEISIWIDRLNEWWDALPPENERSEENRPCRGDYLSALMAFLRMYAFAYPDKAEPILRLHLPEVQALTWDNSGENRLESILCNAAYALERCDDYREAIALYRAALDRLTPDDWAFARKGIRRCRRKSLIRWFLRIFGKPNWRYWT